jgi:exodeoxyribonuclease-3
VTKHAKDAAETKGITLVSWNVNGLRAVVKKGFLDYLREEEPDILAIQETKCQPEQVPDEVSEYPGYHQYYHSAERKGYSGVALFTREEPEAVSASIGDERFDCEGRVLRADYDSFTLFNVYFPNGTSGEERLAYKLEFFEHFFALVDGVIAEGHSVVICGDYNIAHKPIDLARPKANEGISGFLPEERAVIDSLVERGYIDTFRRFNSEPDQYSWWSYRFGARGKNVGWRIDYFFSSADMAPRLKDAWIRQDVMGSDHCPVGLTLQ